MSDDVYCRVRISQVHPNYPVLKAEFTLGFSTTSNQFVSMPVRLDTGAEFSTIPIHLADEHGIPFNRDQCIATYGVGDDEISSYINPVEFRFPGRKERLSSDWSFTESKRPYGLFGLTDLQRFFHFRLKDPEDYEPPYGHFDLELRDEFTAPLPPLARIDRVRMRPDADTFPACFIFQSLQFCGVGILTSVPSEPSFQEFVLKELSVGQQHVSDDSVEMLPGLHHHHVTTEAESRRELLGGFPEWLTTTTARFGTVDIGQTNGLFLPVDEHLDCVAIGHANDSTGDGTVRFNRYGLLRDRGRLVAGLGGLDFEPKAKSDQQGDYDGGDDLLHGRNGIIWAWTATTPTHSPASYRSSLGNRSTKHSLMASTSVLSRSGTSQPLTRSTWEALRNCL